MLDFREGKKKRHPTKNSLVEFQHTTPDRGPEDFSALFEGGTFRTPVAGGHPRRIEGSVVLKKTFSKDIKQNIETLYIYIYIYMFFLDFFAWFL